MKHSTKSNLLFLLLFVVGFACTTSVENAERVFSNGTVYTMDEANPKVEAVAVTDGVIVFAGTNADAQQYIGDDTDVVDLEGKAMTPGLIESHAHMMGVGFNELNLDLMYARNYDEVVKMVKQAVDKAEPGQWIRGRGWHQSKWVPQPESMVNGFQTHHKLSEASPDNPVYLSHASGHASFANAKAMEIAGVNQLSVESLAAEIQGGEIMRDALGNPTGVFTERASRLVARHVPNYSDEETEMALNLAIQACHRNGITSFHDAGSGNQTVELYQKFKEQGKLGVRMYVMLSGNSPERIQEWLTKGPVIDSVDNLLTIRSLKLNCDGALGSRGAWLIDEYTDRPGHFGLETQPMAIVDTVSKMALEAGFQVCSHAIGDRANREILDRYEIAFNNNPEKALDHRFRIEHAQHLSLEDIPRFAELNVIPAMQAIHMASDRPWAIDRLGEKRIVDGAYVWKKLLQSGARVINGTDAPVEPINPIPSFYASVSRKTLAGTPEGGYEPDQKMSRYEALRSYTLDAAYGEFAENVKGSIEVGKLADFVIFTKDIMTIDEAEILSAEVLMTVFNGDVVYSRKSSDE